MGFAPHSFGFTSEVSAIFAVKIAERFTAEIAKFARELQ
jgi:hypothetical protein